MRDTGSSRTATRWRSSKHVALGVALAAAGCVTTQTRYYVPTEGQPRYGLIEMKDRAELMLGAECPRLLGRTGAEMGEGQYVVDVDGGGRVTRAQVARSSGDARMDEIFGGLLAELAVDAPADGKPRSARVDMGYSCAASGGAVTVRGIEPTGLPAAGSPPDTAA